jgi:enolase
MLGVSMAVARAAAVESGTSRSIGTSAARWRAPCPVPLMNILNGGAHATNTVDFQEYMIVPVGAESFCEALRMGAEVFHSLKKVLVKRKLSTGVGDEGRLRPRPQERRGRAQGRHRGHRARRLRAGQEIALALDCAASELFEKKGSTRSRRAAAARATAEGMVELYAKWLHEYPIVSIEDGLAEDDWDGWSAADRRHRRSRASSSATTSS